MRGRYFDGWRFDVAGASVATILFVAGMALGLSRSFLYGGGFLGAFPLLLAFFIGPWAAAFVTNKVLPSGRRRLIVRLAAVFSLASLSAGLFWRWLGRHCRNDRPVIPELDSWPITTLPWPSFPSSLCHLQVLWCCRAGGVAS